MGNVEMYKRRILEVLLDAGSVDVSLQGSRAKSRNMIIVSLIWPRPGIYERVSVVTPDFECNKMYIRDSEWSERILFKEVVQGPFALKVSVTEPVSDKKLDEFMANMGSSLFKTAASELSDFSVGPLMGSLAKVPLMYLSSKTMSFLKESAAIIGTGTACLCADAKWKSGCVKRVTVPLVAPDAVFKTFRRKRHGESIARKRSVLKAGQKSGEISLSIMLYD